VRQNEEIICAYWSSSLPGCVNHPWRGLQRLFLHRSIASDFIERFLTLTKAYRIGDKQNEETDMGALINEAAAQRVEQNVNEALAAGARALIGTQRSGTSYLPTLLEGVPDTSPLATEEIYGPVTMLFQFDTLEEAIERANAVDYGLQAGIFTQSIHTAFEAVQKLQCGG
jgi:glyceraldehyde-3-phosphate dehydrogenase (NADP+)